MRSLTLTTLLSLSLISFNSIAGSTTLQAIQDTGITLSLEQLNNFSSEKCSPTQEEVATNQLPPACSSLVDSVANLISSFAGDDATVESIMRAASAVHPELAQAFGEAAIITTPTQAGLLASLITELAPAAAGAPLGLAALASGNVPSPVSPGSSPALTLNLPSSSPN